MSTVATLVVRVAGDTKDAEKAFAGLERAGQSLERAYSGFGTRLSGVGGDLAKGLGASLSGIESAAGKAFGALDQGLGKVGQALGPIANMLPGLPGGVSALAGAFSGFLPVAGVLGGVGVALGAIGGIAVGIVGGLVALGKSAADAGDAMLVLSQQSGISVENLSRFQYVEQQTDASVDKIVGSIRKLGTNLVDGSKEANKAITSIGLSLADVKKLKPEDAFVAIVDGLGKIPGAGQRAAAGAAIFGKGWHDVSQLASEDLRGLMKEADLFGATMSTELAVAGDRFNDTLGQLSTVVEGFTRAAGAGVLPVLTAVAEVLRDQVIKYLQATGTTAATTQATFETFAITVAVTMLQVAASVARGLADLARLFAKPIIGDSVVFRELQRFIRMVSVINGIKLDTLDTVASGAQAMADAATMTADALEKDLAGALARVKAEIAAAAKAMKDGQTAALGYSTATTAVDDKLQKLIDTMSGATVIAKARELMNVFAALTARGLKPSAEGLKSLIDAIKDAAAVAHSKGGQLADDMVLLYQSIIPPARSLGDDLSKFANEIARFARGLVPSVKSNLKPVTQAVFDAFRIDGEKLGKQLERDLANAALADRVSTMLKDVGTRMKTQMGAILGDLFTGQTSFTDGFRSMLGVLNGISAEIMTTLVKEIGTEFKKGAEGSLASVFGGKDAKQGAAVGAAVGLAAGMAFGSAFGKEVGAVAGAASGAAAGAMVGGWVGAGVGAGVGFVTGWLAGIEKESQQRQALDAAKSDLIAQFGNMTKLRKAAEQAGVDFDAMWDTQKPAEFNKWLTILQTGLTANRDAVDQMNKSLDTTIRTGALLSRVDLSSIGAFTGRTGNESDRARGALPGSEEGAFAFIQSQQAAALKGLDTFLSNATIKTQQGAAAISASLAGLYQTLLEGGATPTQAFAQMEPAIAKLNAQLAATGLTASSAFGPLGALAEMAASEIGGPMMDAMAGLDQGLTATANLGLLNQETFAGFAAEMLNGFKVMEAQGKGGEVALAGMQGGLQKLWELSTDFGYTLTEDEQAMVDFAKASGTVGDQFRPAADRMANAIDALIDRLDRFIDKIAGIGDNAKSASGKVAGAFGEITLPPIQQPVEFVFERPENAPPGWTYAGATAGATAMPALAGGGIVTRPTIALIGEQGPEAVVPLSKDLRGGGDTNIYLDGEIIARSVTKRQPGVLRAYGVMR